MAPVRNGHSKPTLPWSKKQKKLWLKTHPQCIDSIAYYQVVVHTSAQTENTDGQKMLLSKNKRAAGTLKQNPEAQGQQTSGRGRGQGKEKETMANAKNTRRADNKSGQLSRAEIEMLPGQEIMNAKEGMRYLESTLLTVPDIPYTTESITRALFQILMLPGIKANRTNADAI
jgi:hypothetical protein